MEQLDIRITMSRTKRGSLLATVRVLTCEDVQWHRITLREEVNLAAVQHSLVATTLAHLERRGTPSGRLVTLQLALPVGGK